jgi:glycosyltransferase involved in cell wall biosynthesis
MTKIFNPLVSIVIPVYNGSNYIQEAIDSALSQTYKNTEVIVVNDGSNDNEKTDKIATSYGKKIRYFKKENGGVATALNLGIEKMRGEYFSWLSHDDVYYPDKIEKQINYLKNINNNNKVILFSNFEFISSKLNNRGIYRFDKKYEGHTFLLLFMNTVNGCTVLVPKSGFKKAGLFNPKNKSTQDYEMWLKLAAHGYHFINMDDIIVKTRIHENQTSIVMGRSHYNEIVFFYNWAINLFFNEIICNTNDIINFLLKRRLFGPMNTLLRKLISTDLKVKNIYDLIYFNLKYLKMRINI